MKDNLEIPGRLARETILATITVSSQADSPVTKTPDLLAEITTIRVITI
jgi:hypothetical protein